MNGEILEAFITVVKKDINCGIFDDSFSGNIFIVVSGNILMQLGGDNQ